MIHSRALMRWLWGWPVVAAVVLGVDPQAQTPAPSAPPQPPAPLTIAHQVVFSLAEVDPAFTGGQIIVADSVDGKPLFDYQGPLRIVAPGDKRGARSIRMLERIEIVRVTK
jgi:hypothetical protein